jgi:hypothetical protein
MTYRLPPTAPAQRVPWRRRGHRWMILCAAVILMVAAGIAVYGLNRSRVAHQQQAKSLHVGDCVIVPSLTPRPLHATKAPCGVDPSYTIGAVTNASGACPSTEYQQFPTQFADPSTANLCLVPNLVVNHCYALDMPVGMVTRADCSERGRDVVVQVTQRLDAHDQHACPAAGGHYAWPYPSPARTYCTLTLY